MVCVVWALSCKWRANETESQSNSTVQATMAILDKIWQRFAESHFFQLLLRVTSIRAQACKELASFAMCISCVMVASITSRTKQVQKPVAIAWLNIAHCPNMPFLHTRKNIVKGRVKPILTSLVGHGGTISNNTTRSLLPCTRKQCFTLRGRSFASFWKPLLNSLHIKTADWPVATQTVRTTATLFHKTGQQTLAL